MATLGQVAEAAARGGANQEWARIPRTGETLEGLYRSQLFALIRSGEIKTAAIKAPGAGRCGMRLVHVPSLRGWIEKHVESEVTA